VVRRGRAPPAAAPRGSARFGLAAARARTRVASRRLARALPYPPLLPPLPSSILSHQHGAWEKKHDFDLAVRVPLIVRLAPTLALRRTADANHGGRAAAPPPPSSGGATTRAIVELIDVMPTLAALYGPPATGSRHGDRYALLFSPWTS